MIDQNEVQKIEPETKKSKATANKEKEEKIKRLLSMKRKFLEWKKDLSLITKESYIERYLAEEVPGWNASRYKHTLKQLNLTVLVDNPFLLKIALETLPSLDETEQDGTGRQHFTRIALYDQFMHNWFQRSKNRLKLIQLTDEEEKIFKHLSNGGFSAFSIHSIDFSQKLAMAMHKAQVVAITFPDQIWKPFLNNESEETKLLRFNAPLIRQGNQYRFIHKTLQDYLVARALWKELESLTEIKHSGSPHKFEIVRNDIRLVWQKLRGFNELKSSLLFNELNIVKDPAVQSFLLERLQQNQSLLKVLLSWVKSSKEQAGIERAAANAITLLVKAGVYFNRLDLSQVKVPGADLSYGLFDHTRFQNADLKGVNCTGAWLRGVNLNGANLADLELGERPILKTKNWIDACCYSPDGLWLVTSERKDIQLYKVEGLQKIHTYTGHEGGVNNVAFSPDSQWLASGGGDKVKLWYVSGDRSLAHTYTGHKGKVASIAFSPNGQWLASGSKDKTVKLWDVLGERTLLHTYAENRGEVHCLAFSPDSQWLAAGFGFYDSTIKLWNVLGDWSLVHAYTEHESSTAASVTFSPDGKWLASGNYDSTVKLWNVLGERILVHTYTGHSGIVRSVVFSPEGEWLASGSSDKSVKLWRVTGERFLIHTYTGNSEQINSVAFSPNGQWLASSGWRSVKLWSVSGVRHTHAGHEGEVNGVAFSADGHWLASGSEDKTVRLWSVLDNKSLTHTYVGHKGKVKSIAFSPDGQWLASGSRDSSIKLWHVSGDRSLAHTYNRHENLSLINSVVFSPDSQWLASGRYDNTVHLWHVSGDRSLVHIYVGHSSSVNSVAFSPDGQWLASGSDDNTVKLWNILDDKFLAHTYVGHEDSVKSVAFSPDSQWLASGSRDNTIKLWAASGCGQLIYTYTGHTDYVNSVAFSPNGRWLASGSNDETVRLWPVLTDGFQIALQSIIGSSWPKKLLSIVDNGLHETLLALVDVVDRQVILKNFTGPVHAVAWQPNNGAILSTAGADGTLRLWRVSYGLSQIYTVALDWASKQDTLTARGSWIINARNLSTQNRELLMQHDAVGSHFRKFKKLN
ncbi:MAG: WD40 repeat [Glomeribacter sp. 1016415]|nr:WD40 repeat [Glomeribacter sp. 1016415]